ncbi:MAG TPA: sigma-54 dependent transcriptional regulator [Spirochaetia bacterium]
MKILVVDDERNIRESIQRLFELEGIDSATATDGRDAATRLSEEAFDAVVLDLKMPVMDGQALLEWMKAEGLRTPVVMISALGDINDAVRALKTGASDYLIKPFDPTELILKVKTVVGGRKREDLLEAGVRTATGELRLLGDSPSTRAMRQLIEKVAPGSTTVLITGESGTGKEVVAREIHALSGNAAEPFVAVNIGGIHETLVESELFGHEKGAFTGADSRKTGLFELAEAGTLFLDEIAEMPLPLQVKLLRVLQERKIRRLGGTRDIPIGARIISATNKDIEAMVKDGTFREDLYYRLNVVRITVAPLRERKEDIPLLVGHFLEKIRARTGRTKKTVSPDAMDALLSYSYPGNIRELENILERAFITSEGDRIMAADLGLEILKKHATAARGPGAESPSLRGPLKPMAEMEKDALAAALAKWNGNRTKAAQELGLSRRTILNKIKQYGL